MEEIKSVRVRKSVPEGDENIGSGDIKVTLFKDRKFFRDIRIVRGTQDGRVIWGDSEYSGSRYENQPDEYIIDDFIRVNTISKGFPQTVNDNSGEVVNYYEVIQDPYGDKPPKIRNFGYDPYYLNNGAVLYIEWVSDTSGKVWNNSKSISNNAEEFQYENEMRDHFFYNLGNTQSADSEASDLFNKKREGEKTIFCIYRKNGINEKFYISEGEEVQVAGTNMMSRNYIFTTDSSLQKIYDGDILDLQIYNEFINRWNIEVPNYNVGLCNPDSVECEYIKYINPVKSTDITPSAVTPTSATSSSVEKFKLNVVLPDDLKLKVKEDLPSLKIYLGEPPSDFIFQDQDEFDMLSDEYTEDEFLGLEEIYLGPALNVIDDTLDNDSDRGFDNSVLELPKSGSVNDKQSAFIKNAVNSTQPSESKSGKCARYTFNHANNYCLQILGRALQGVKNPAGGNANGEGYHKNLERLGYKRYDRGTVDKESIRKALSSNNWDIGDVVAYWGLGSENSEKGGVKYGHTQIYTGGLHNNSKYVWSTDHTNNFKSGFVYSKYTNSEWRFIIFKAPQPKSSSV